VQDASVAVVVDFDGCIDAADRLEFNLAAVRFAGRYRHFLARPDGVVNIDGVEL
jgi:hypothetical protein